jgi:hypothetical protein
MALEVAQRQSSAFDMFNNHPHRFATLAPRQAVTLRVTFDPNYHGPEGLGLSPKAVPTTAGDLS